MSLPRCTALLIVAVVLSISFGQTCVAQSLSGSVYQGSVGDTSQPLAGVTLRLYGSNKTGSLGTEIDNTSTNANGQYSLDAGKVYELYTIVEEDPTGYVSVGATSVDGSVIGDNSIRYAYPLVGKVLSKNRFWDKKQQTNQAPVAEAGGPYSGYVGQWITFDGSKSYDPDQNDQIVEWRWDMDNDGQYDDAQGQIVQWKWDAPTSGTVALRVMDTHQATDTDTASYTVEPQPVQTGEILGIVFHDMNGNGTQDQGESGLAGWKIFLDTDDDGMPDFGEIMTVTWDDGRYLLGDLDPDVYVVRVVLEEGWVHTLPSSGSHVTTIQPGQRVERLNFGTTKAAWDFGDAPDSDYGTLLAGNGARHRIDPDLCLGYSVDAEADGQPDPLAQGDDTDTDGDDEDGVVFLTDAVPGHAASFDLTVTNHRANDRDVAVACWLDVDGDGTWHLRDELLDSWILTAAAGVTSWTLSLDIPPAAVPGRTFARFRLYPRDDPNLAVILMPTGAAGDGEVEDYMLEIVVSKEATLDFGDAPDPYLTLEADDGARHTADPNLCLGEAVDADLDGQPEPLAQGDDTDADGDDEDGVQFLTDLVPGREARLAVTLTNHYPEDKTVCVMGWIDFNDDGIWHGPDEAVIDYWTYETVPGGDTLTQEYVFDVPADAVPSVPFARFRLYAEHIFHPMFVPTPDHYGLAGEVEDYAVEVLDPTEELWDYGDAIDPMPTRLSEGGPRHKTDPNLCLGTRVDSDPDGQPDVEALGDDTDIMGDDEDGIEFLTGLVAGQPARVAMTVTNGSDAEEKVLVAGWIDFNADGTRDADYDFVLEEIITVPARSTITHEAVLGVRSGARSGVTYARFRLYRAYPLPVVLSPEGDGGDGEVEDYLVRIGQTIDTAHLTGDPGWTTEGAWEFGRPLGAGGAHGYPDPDSGYSDRNVYGVNLAGDYDPTPGGPYYLTAGPFDCSGYAEVYLRFMRWLNTDAGLLVRNTVEVSGEPGVWELIWQSPEDAPITEDAWHLVEYDISAAAACKPGVYVRWGYEILAGALPYSGWNIDDIRIWGHRAERVRFADSDLRAAVERALGVTNPTTCDMLSLITLNADGLGIADLTGLEHARNLETLHLVTNNISDISPLQGLDKLRVIRLSDNDLADISALRGLGRVVDLSLDRNHIRSIDPLADLTNLRYLHLGVNEIRDIVPLAGLTNLETLGLFENRIGDLSALGGLTNLRSLSAGTNDIRDAAPLAGLVNLNTLDLHTNLISDLTPLAGLANLISLRLETNEIRDLSPLRDLTSLTSLDLSANEIRDVRPLARMTDLEFLRLTNNQIVDISPLGELRNLALLRLTNNEIRDISALEHLVGLGELRLGANEISDIAVLEELVNLQGLYLHRNHIVDISPLVHLSRLVELHLEGNPLSAHSCTDLIPLIEANNPALTVLRTSCP